jgi:hypothetical protein
MTYDLNYRGEVHRKLVRVLQEKSRGEDALSDYMLDCLRAWEKAVDSGLTWHLDMVYELRVPSYTVHKGLGK